MSNFSCDARQPGARRLLILCVLTLGLVVGPGVSPLGQSPVSAADAPEKGGTVVFAVHEYGPSFDLHYETSYIAMQGLGPLYNGLVTFDLYDHNKIKKVGVTEKIVLLDTAAIRDRTLKGDFQAYTLPASAQFEDPDVYYERLVCGAASNTGRYCDAEFDKLFKAQSEEFDVKKRIEITRKMERIILQDIPDDHGYHWMAIMGYWNRLQKWPPPVSGTMVFNFGKFEQVWCKGGKCM